MSLEKVYSTGERLLDVPPMERIRQNSIVLPFVLHSPSVNLHLL
jgi:hypothetical protein